jgi:DNA (cytosine-5)-methyltransferase 1
MLNGLSLFSGIGGIDLALSEWVRPVAYCEIEPYAAGVLFSRMLDGSLPTAPVFPDVTKLTADILPPIDIIYGGFPCQDLSCAGRQAGLSGERSGLFFEIVRLVGECKPTFVFLENVPAIRPYRPDVFAAFENLGYECRDGTLAAAHVGACHIRNRWWFIAHTIGNRGRPNPTGHRLQAESAELQQQNGEACANNAPAVCGDVADTESQRRRTRGAEFEGQQGGSDVASGGPVVSNSEGARKLQCGWQQQQKNGDQERDVCFWKFEPDVGRVVNGLPLRVDRVKGLGNAVVPQCAKEAFKRLMGLD